LHSMNLFSRLFGAPGATDSPLARVVDVHEVSRRQTAGALVIDVREPDEWRQGHVARAVLIPLGTLTNALARIPRDRDLLLICRSGNRSGSAQRELRRLGYERVFNVSGGMNAWARAGLPLAD
jgi:rhodanese-related sulfurtransferase